MFISRSVYADYANNMMPYRTTGFYGHWPRNGYKGYVCFVFPERSRFYRVIVWPHGDGHGRKWRPVQIQRKSRCFKCNAPARQTYRIYFPDTEDKWAVSQRACTEHRGSARMAGKNAYEEWKNSVSS